MAKQYMIDVIREDIDLGEMRDSNRCAVKRAVARCIEGATRVEVDLQTVRFSLNGERHVFLTPWQVVQYVIDFDAGLGEEMEPFTFRLRPSAQVGSAVRRDVFTEEGQKVDNARNRVRKAKAKKTAALETLSSDDATPVEVAKAEETLATIDKKIEKAEAAYVEERASAKASKKPLRQRVDNDKPKAPRLAKVRTRTYGIRKLRVNQGEDRVHIVDNLR